MFEKIMVKCEMYKLCDFPEFRGHNFNENIKANKNISMDQLNLG